MLVMALTPVKKSIPGFIPIRLSTIRPGQRLTMNVYIPVGNPATKFGLAGDDVDEFQIDKLKARKINKIFIREEDELKYRNYLEDVISEAENNQAIAMEERASTMASSAESAAQEVIDNVDNKDIYLESFKKFERFGTFLKAYQAGLGVLLNDIGSRPPDHMIHSTHCAALALALADKMELINSEAKRASLIGGALLMDIALEQNQVPFGDLADLSPEHQKIYNEHPTLGAKLLGDKDYVDQNVTNIVLQHEECDNGSGFPRKLMRKDMDPYARIVAFCNLFVRYCHKASGDKKEAMKAFTMNEIGRFELDLIDLSKKVFAENAK